MLVELSKMEQRYDAVLGVIRDGYSVAEVAEAYGVSRQSVHAWLARYEKGGVPALADRSHRPRSSPLRCPQQSRPESSNCDGNTPPGVRSPSATGWRRRG